MLAGLLEGLGLGAARDARRLVAQLPKDRSLRVAADEESLARALSRARHAHVVLQAGAEAEAGLTLALPDGELAIATLTRLIAATRAGGEILVAMASGLGEEGERARVAGLFLRVGLTNLHQATERGLLVMRGHVGRGAVDA